MTHKSQAIQRHAWDWMPTALYGSNGAVNSLTYMFTKNKICIKELRHSYMYAVGTVRVMAPY